MLSSPTFSVVIAGGGFCGVMTLVHLINKTNKPVQLTLINKGNPVARGIAYKTYSDLHLLNVAAGNMSAFPDEPDHFVKWCLNQNDIGFDSDQLPFTFLPRNIYGRYIEEIFSKTIGSSRNGSSVSIVEDEVLDVVKEGNRLMVKTKSGKDYAADKFVLATGNDAPGPPVLTDSAFLNSRNYFANPWCEDAVTGLSNNDTALIIGTGLTMVDVVIGLREKNFNGKIITLSPHGFGILPHRKHRPQRYILDELAPPYTLDSLFHLFYKHIRQARKHGESGETVVDSIRSKTPEIWQQLSLADKKKFMSHLRHLWGVARHRLPLHVYDQIQKMIKQKKLEVIAGRIRTIKECEKGIEVNILRRNQSEITLETGRIINCTGPQTDIRKQNNALFNNLLKSGMIRSDEMNLGVDATAEGRIIDANNNVSDQIFTLGSLLKGKLWESTAVPELRLQAKRTAELILSE